MDKFLEYMGYIELLFSAIYLFYYVRSVLKKKKIKEFERISKLDKEDRQKELSNLSISEIIDYGGYENKAFLDMVTNTTKHLEKVPNIKKPIPPPTSKNK